MKYTKPYLEKLNAAIDIVELAESYGIKLSSNGPGRYTAHCIFHKGDNTASLTIYEETNSFWCYGCEAGHTPIELIRLAEKLGFVEAVQRAEQIAKLEKEDTTSLTAQVEQQLDAPKPAEQLEIEHYHYISGLVVRDTLASLMSSPNYLERAAKADKILRALENKFNSIIDVEQAKLVYEKLRDSIGKLLARKEDKQ